MEVVSCPKCQLRSRVPESLLGKQVKCPGCGELFATAVDAPAPIEIEVEEEKAAKDEADDDAYEVVGKGKRKRRRGDDEDEERSRRSRHDDEDDDEDDEDRPRRKARRRRRRATNSLPFDLGRLEPLHYVLLGALALGLLTTMAAVVLPALVVVPIVLGVSLMIAGQLWLLLIAFQDETVHGLLCLLVPFYSLYYLITRFGETHKAFFLWLGGLVVLLMVWCCGGAAHAVVSPRRRPRGELQAPARLVAVCACRTATPGPSGID